MLRCVLAAMRGNVSLRRVDLPTRRYRYSSREESGVCLQCGIAFTYMRHAGTLRKHCSPECRQAYQIARRIPWSQRPFNPALRIRTCKVCSEQFSYPIGRGSDRRICSDACRTRARHANAKAQPLCVVEGCANRRGSYSSGICNSCYCRLRRTGTLEKRVWNYRSLSSHGYVCLFASDHPLSTPEGFVYEHRKVLYDAIGSGSHPCHWCKMPVEWHKRSLSKDSLIPDHLDGDKTNNSRENLVPACNRCNARRGMFMVWVTEHKDDPVLWDMYQQAQRTRTA